MIILLTALQRSRGKISITWLCYRGQTRYICLVCVIPVHHLICMQKNATIFLIDDDVDDQEIFALALAEIDQSYSCITARNGLEALTKLKDGLVKPDFIFLDLNMPRMNGKQCLEELKKHPTYNNIPVVVYSTSSETRDKDQILTMGAAAFVTKPPEIQALIESLRNIFTNLS